MSSCIGCRADLTHANSFAVVPGDGGNRLYCQTCRDAAVPLEARIAALRGALENGADQLASGDRLHAEHILRSALRTDDEAAK